MMVGVQATGKTQVREMGNRRGAMWHPVGDAIAEAATNDGSGLTKPYIHVYFTDREMAVGITNVMRRTKHYSQGVQFNGLSWVDNDYSQLLTRFVEDYPSQSVILQASGSVLNGSSPKQLADKLADAPVDYVLLDPSGGWGTKMNCDHIREYVDEIYQRQIPVGVAVAGGLDASSIEELFAPLAESYPGLSCDAEGRLRKGPEGATELDLLQTNDYLIAWKGIVKSLDTRTAK